METRSPIFAAFRRFRGTRHKELKVSSPNRPQLVTPQDHPPTEETASPWLDTTRAADYIGSTPGTLAQWRSRGMRLPFHKVGGRVLYKRDDLDNFVESCRVEVDADAQVGR